MALLTRSRLSCTAASGRPTTMVAGKPLATSVSTSINSASRPMTVAVRILGIICFGVARGAMSKKQHQQSQHNINIREVNYSSARQREEIANVSQNDSFKKIC